MPVPGAMGAIVAYQHANFRGRYRLIWSEESNLNRQEDKLLDSGISSFVVMDGNWQFYRQPEFGAPYEREFAPGAYPNVADFGIENSQVSSLRALSENATPGSLPGVAGAAILFERPDFRGAHRIIWGEESNLGHPEDSSLSGAVSSFVVMYGSWKLYRQPGFDTPHEREFGPGAYRDAADVGVRSDQVSSLRALNNTFVPLRGTIVVYEHADFRGPYRVICNEESDLRHAENSLLSGPIASFVVMQGSWKLYRQPGFENPHEREFGPGLYRDAAEAGIGSDQILSLRAL